MVFALYFRPVGMGMGEMAAFSSMNRSLLQKQSFRPKMLHITQISQEELYMLVRHRAQPGILILNQQGQTLYFNHNAKNLLNALMVKNPWSNFRSLPKVIHRLYSEFKHLMNTQVENTIKASLPTLNRICIHNGIVYLFRVLPLQQPGKDPGKDPMMRHILILIEKVSEGVRVDQVFPSAKRTQREQAIVKLLLEGKTNKEIAISLNTNEYAIKEQIKRMMRMFNVTTRAEIVVKILQRHLLSEKEDEQVEE